MIHRRSVRIGDTAKIARSIVLAALVGALAASSRAAPPETQPAALAPADAKMLDQLFADGLFDPAGHRFVTFTVTVRSVWGGTIDRTASGWLGEPRDSRKIGDVAWAVLLSGEAVPVGGTTAPADFVQECRKVMESAVKRAEETTKKKAAANAATQSAKARGDIDGDAIFQEMEERPWRFPPSEPAPFLAAWLHRRGNDSMAASMLALARADPKAEEKGDHPAAIPLHMDAWHWYAGAVHAFMVGADAEALFYVRAMSEYLPQAMKPAQGEGEQKETRYPQAARLLAELERRHGEGAFNRPAPEIPADFSKWPVERRVQWLVQQLQEVDEKQMGQPGGVDLAGDKRVAALIAIGDPAIPALIDCVDTDDRLTRSVHFWRDFSDDRTVLGVREAALTAVMSILHTRIFEPRSTGDNFTSRGADAAKSTAARLKEYWATYGNLPLDARMMKILTDEKAKPAAWREAAENLAHFGEARTLSTTVWTSQARGREPGTGNPVIGRFKNPTAAQAILAAMDRELRSPSADPRDRDRADVDELYIGALDDLADASIVPELSRRLAQSPPRRMRRLLAGACHDLGDSGPLMALAQDVRTGRIAQLPEKEPDKSELAATLALLAGASVKVPAAHAALYAITNPKHPLHDAVAANVRAAGYSYDDRAWLGHPFALCFLRESLDDERLSGTVYSIEQRAGQAASLVSRTGNSSGWNGVPDPLADPAVRLDRVDARFCDDSAARIANAILGVPYYHALLKDRDQRLKNLKALLDAHVMHFRRATYAEISALRGDVFSASYILDIRRLSSGATADDVARGQAIFHFDGKGTPLEMKLPATAALKRDLPPAGKEPTQADADAGRARVGWTRGPDLKDGKGPRMESHFTWDIPRVLILQAERGPDGKIWYGVVSRHDVQKLAEDELAEIEPLREQ